VQSWTLAQEEHAVAEKKNCFIIMPITTPKSMIDEYTDGAEHFKHVLDALFIPSVEKAGYRPISPIAKGADLIHAEIVKNLETSEMVLCDMSCLNPNVFFEFGVRTSLNKPVCVVKDELVQDVPFDAGILNHLEYKSDLAGWRIEQERERLTKHISESAERSNGENTLWKYFGLKTKASTSDADAGSETKLDYLIMRMDSLGERLESFSREKGRAPYASQSDFGAVVEVVKHLTPETALLERIDNLGDAVRIHYQGEFPPNAKETIATAVQRRFGLSSKFVGIPGYLGDSREPNPEGS
jgi:hypothetical protein